MKITHAELAATVVDRSKYPRPPVPAIAFVGRSNVGKSSLINRLLNRKSLARTSSTPGKTATLNFYRVNQAFDLVDLPGYGYAEVSRAKKGQWARMIEEFLLSYEELRGVIQVIDLRHAPSDLDIQMFDWLQEAGIPTTVVATKADKLGRSKWEAHRKVCAESLLLTEAPREALLVASSESGEARDRIWTRIGEYLAQEPVRLAAGLGEDEED